MVSTAGQRRIAGYAAAAAALVYALLLHWGLAAEGQEGLLSSRCGLPLFAFVKNSGMSGLYHPFGSFVFMEEAKHH